MDTQQSNGKLVNPKTHNQKKNGQQQQPKRQARQEEIQKTQLQREAEQDKHRLQREAEKEARQQRRAKYHKAPENTLLVIHKTRELMGYVMDVAVKAPKKYRYNIVNTLINTVIAASKYEIDANDTYVFNHTTYLERYKAQRKALTELKFLAQIAETACDCKCLTHPQFSHIVKLSGDCANLVGAWINSDRKRFKRFLSQ